MRGSHLNGANLFHQFCCLFITFYSGKKKKTKAAIHSIKAPGKENIINLYFRVSVMIGNVTNLRSVLRLCVVLHFVEVFGGKMLKIFLLCIYTLIHRYVWIFSTKEFLKVCM